MMLEMVSNGIEKLDVKSVSSKSDEQNAISYSPDSFSENLNSLKK
jgi:hypothetical protein